MNVYLTKGPRDQVPGDLIHSWLLRSDLVPIPRSLEMTVQLIDGLEERLAVGNTIWSGRELLEFLIVKTKRIRSSVIQGRDPVAALEVTALLASCAPVSFRRDRAVVRYGASLGEIYRSCGASVAIGGDFTVDRFVCLARDVPTFGIARAMQEEAAALVYRGGGLSFVRLHDMMAQDPVDQIGQTDSTDHIDSEFLERHTIPSFYSTNDAGQFVFGNFDQTRAIAYLPYADERRLRNASRVLVTRRTIDNDLAEQVIAGDTLKVGPKKFAVITAAHVMRRGGSDGITKTNSKFWVGDLSV